MAQRRKGEAKMTMEGFVRLALPSIVAVLIIVIIVLWGSKVTSGILKAKDPGYEKHIGDVTRVRNSSIGLAVLVLAIWLIVAASTNLVPRQTLDHRNIDQRQQQYEQRLSTVAPK
jgi:hypothetical protein